MKDVLCISSSPRTYLAGGFEHVCQLTVLEHMSIPGFWQAFDDLPPELARIPDFEYGEQVINSVNR